MAQEPNAHHGGPSAAPAAKSPSADEKAAAELRAAASIGAQVILDFNQPAALGARGGAGASVEENTMIRDAYLVEIGLDPRDASGPVPSKEMVEARRKAAEAAAKAAAEMPHLKKAAKSSSLAADLGDKAA